jgi:gamma-glutamyltranspeptidase / glutathione hydrolase
MRMFRQVPKNLLRNRKAPRLRLAFLFSLIFSVVVFADAQDVSLQGKNGVVSSGSLLASQAGIDMMKRGGNAVDAAVATGFALSVTHPSAGNLGGGTFFLFQNAAGEAFVLDAREVAPLAASKKMFQDEHGNVVDGLSTKTHLATGVPGTVDGLLMLHERFGKLSRQQVMAPAIRLAEKGFVIDQALAMELKRQEKSFSVSDASLKVFTRNGRAHEEGYLWKQKDLARTLKAISRQGRAGFYEGRVAQLIVDEMQRGNGIITLDDLKQ